MPSHDARILQLRQRIDYEALFGEFVRLEGRGEERKARCIFHEDTHPSMSINVQEGYYKCHNPSCTASAGGDFIDFYMRVRSLSFREALRELCQRNGVEWDEARPRVPVDPEFLARQNEELLAGYTPEANGSHTPETERIIDEAIVEATHDRLMNTPAWVEYLAEKRGLTERTLQEYKLGHDGDRYYIPVRNEHGQTVNIRRYKPTARRAQDKMLSWRAGYGSARLFPIDRLEEGDVYIFEGEMDCLLARQLGLNAVTATGGAGTWRGEEWNRFFEGRNVVVCYDSDPAGRTGAANVAASLSSIAESVKVVQIPLAEPVGADFTDFIVGHGHSAADFLRLVEAAPPFILTEEARVRPSEDEPTNVHLSQASRAEHYNRMVRFPVLVSGKTTSPYIVPEEVRVGCPNAVRGTLTFCSRCPVAEAGGPITKRIEFESNEVLQFTDVPVSTLAKSVKAKVGIPAKCNYARHDVVNALNVEKVQIIPEIERTDEEAPYVTREAFYLGHGLQANRSYMMTAMTVPEPKKQLATHIIHNAVQAQSNIDAFRLSPPIVERLRLFNPATRGSVALWQRLATIYADIERYTRIYQRRDLMLTTDLVFHSVLKFRFQGDLLQRGWCEALIIGDSRTGKTTVVQRMLEHYGAGEFSTGENTTLAGLIGGLHQIGTTWVLQWGRIPLNDRRLLVIDEFGNLPLEQIARMSSMRSSGIAEIIKVHTERTNARTRGIYISNPRSPRPLSSFSQGVIAVKELVGAPEDIARFDIVATAASGDVPLNVVNASRIHEQPETFTSELCHQRVMWAWSRSADQIVWKNGADAKVLELATEQGEKYRYVTDIPLVEPNEQRVKLARLAVATACIFFSASEDGEEVWVQPEHVDFAYKFLETTYAKPSLAFAEYAEGMRSSYQISNETAIREIMLRNPHAVQSFLAQENLTQRDIQEILSFNDRDELRQAITRMRDIGFLRRQGSSYYLKTPAAIQWLRQQVIEQQNGNRLALLDGEEAPDDPPF